ncbi:MAG: hypothetical protein WBQ14_00910 [Gaiellaceae bacterium]
MLTIALQARRLGSKEPEDGTFIFRWWADLHIDSYAIDHPKRHHTEVDRRQLQVGTWDGEIFTWLADKNKLPLQLNVNDAKAAAERLYSAVRELARPAHAPASR